MMAGGGPRAHLRAAVLLAALVATKSGRGVLTGAGSSEAVVGVDYSVTFSRQPLSPDAAGRLVKERGIRSVKLFQFDAQLLDALAKADVREVVLGIPNYELHALATKEGHAAKLAEQLVAYCGLVSLVTVGNEPLADWWAGQYITDLADAVANMQTALGRLKCRGNRPKATVALQFGVVADAWPPSGAHFDSRVEDVVKKIIANIRAARAPMLINMYPYLAWRAEGGAVPLDYARMDASADCATTPEGTCYRRLIDAMIDAAACVPGRASGEGSALHGGSPACLSSPSSLRVAIAKVEPRGLEFQLGEIGWPSGGAQPGADIHSACAFTNALIAHAAHGRTPMGAKVPKLYIFELTDEYDKSPGVGGAGDTERHYGILSENGTEKFGVNWAPASAEEGDEAVAACPKPRYCQVDGDCIPPVGSDVGSLADDVCFVDSIGWCVPKRGVSAETASRALGWLCAPESSVPGGDVDCEALNGATGLPRCASADVFAKAAWAATRYVRLKGNGTCDFDGAFELGPAPPAAVNLCPAGTCESSSPSRAAPGRGQADWCLSAEDCGGRRTSIRSILVGPTCDRRPRGDSAAGSCVALPSADEPALVAALQWVCGEGGVDCTAMQELCAASPLADRATWAFSQYAAARQGNRTCYFGGTAQASRLPLHLAAPACIIGVCRFPTENIWQTPIFVSAILLCSLGYAILRILASRRIAKDWADHVGAESGAHNAHADPSSTGDGELAMRGESARAPAASEPAAAVPSIRVHVPAQTPAEEESPRLHA